MKVWIGWVGVSFILGCQTGPGERADETDQLAVTDQATDELTEPEGMEAQQEEGSAEGADFALTERPEGPLDWGAYTDIWQEFFGVCAVGGGCQLSESGSQVVEFEKKLMEQNLADALLMADKDDEWELNPDLNLNGEYKGTFKMTVYYWRSQVGLKGSCPRIEMGGVQDTTGMRRIDSIQFVSQGTCPAYDPTQGLEDVSDIASL